MTLRPLPEIKAPTLAGDVTVQIPKKALENWDRSVTALASENTISIFDVIGDFYDGGVSVPRVAAALRSIGNEPVTIQINSPGGVYDDGVAIYNLLRLHPAKVTTQVVGMAASAASIIAMAGDEIQIGKAAHMMVHNTQWVAIGDRHVMREVFDAMSIFDETLANIYVDRTGIGIEEVHAMMDRTTYLRGPDAVEQGFADAFLPADAVTKAKAESGSAPLAYRVEAALQKDGWSRAERRAALKELLGGKPSAATDDMPSAVEETRDGLNMLRLAAARLSLVGA